MSDAPGQRERQRHPRATMPARSAAVAALAAVLLAAGCGSPHDHRAGPPVLPGTTRQTIAWGGQARTYLLHRSAAIDPPMVVVLHGATVTAEQTERYYHWDSLADANGFVVVYPQGVANAWNAGSCCGDAPDLHTDDVGFVDAVLAAAGRLAGADPRRRYLTGVSNGAMMTLRYQCERPGRLAAIGSVAGTFTSRCDHPPPVPFIAIHGLDDQVVTFAKGSSTAESGPAIRLPAEETIGRFLAADGCPVPLTVTAGAVHTQSATCRPGLDVEAVTIDGAGHQWPGATIDPVRLARDGPHDQPSPALDATALLWGFFQRHFMA